MGFGRSGYSDDGDETIPLAMWRGTVASATRGKRGQKFFRDLVAALDAMPTKRLVEGELQTNEGEVCALGSLGKHRGVDVDKLDTEDPYALGAAFDIASQLAQETMYENDEASEGLTPEQRWTRVRAWAAAQVRATPEPTRGTP